MTALPEKLEFENKCLMFGNRHRRFLKETPKINLATYFTTPTGKLHSPRQTHQNQKKKQNLVMLGAEHPSSPVFHRLPVSHTAAT